jgi:hypothetical protein
VVRPPKRRYAVTLSAAEEARLRRFDNKTRGLKPWPLGGNSTFLRRDETTFTVKEWSGMPSSGAHVATLGTATLLGERRVAVEIANKGLWLGWLLLLSGVLVTCATLREGLPALLLGAAMVAASWFLFLRPSMLVNDLDEVEKVMRGAIGGDWVPE